MIDTGFQLFDTGIGRCALAWGKDGILGLQLPEVDEGATRARILRRHPGARETAPPEEVAAVIGELRRLLGGEARDLSAVPLDMSGLAELDRRVYAVTRSIPPGQTITYGEIASRLGDPGLARAIGQILGRNPYPILVPCHRVVASGGRPGGFSATGGVETKRRLLEIERARGLHPILPWGT